jgi:RNA polymerase sigma factor (sigma-70 family)
MHNRPAQPDEEGVRWGRWMMRAQDGDETAYRALLMEMVPHLNRFFAGRLGGREDVDDAVQDVLLTVHQIRATYDPARPFKPWLHAIAKRRMIDRLRRRRRIFTHEVALAAEHETFPEVQTNIREGALSLRDAQAAIDTLPARQRKAFVMLKLRELSLKQAATESGMSIGSLKVAVHRAVRTLQSILHGERK